MSLTKFFDMDPESGDIKRLLAFICIVGGTVIGGLAVIAGLFTVEVGSFVGLLLGSGITILGKIAYDKQKENGNDVTPPTSM